MARSIFGVRVEPLNHVTHDCDLSALHQLVRQYVLRSPLRPLTIIEVGSWVGESAVAMATALGPFGGTVTCVDTWEGTASDRIGKVAQEAGTDAVFQRFLDNVSQMSPYIQWTRGDSLAVAGSLGPVEADLVFLDADHSCEAVRADIAAWWPAVAPGGVLCGHDYCPEFPGVVKAVEERFPDARVYDGSSIWAARKSP